MCSELVNEFRFSNQHEHYFILFFCVGGGGGVNLYSHFIRERMFTLVLNEIFNLAPKVMRKMATSLTMNLPIILY